MSDALKGYALPHRRTSQSGCGSGHVEQVEVFLQEGLDSSKDVLGQLLAALLGKMNQINELLMLAIQMGMRVHQSHLRVSPGDILDERGMELVGLNLPLHLREAGAVELDNIRVASVVDCHREIGQHQTDAVRPGDLS